jgi:hypothetical protein
MAAIARSYQCTAPAIRYIVRQFTHPPLTDVATTATAPHFRDRSAARLLDEIKRYALDDAVWSRVNSDILTFVSAFDAFFAARTVENEEALLSATVQILRSRVHSRFELQPAMTGYERSRFDTAY